MVIVINDYCHTRIRRLLLSKLEVTVPNQTILCGNGYCYFGRPKDDNK